MAMEIDADDSGGNGLVGDKPFGEKLIACHRKIHGGPGYGSLGRMAVATYDRDSDALSVHADSDLRGQPFRLWSAPLSSVPSLYALAPSGQVRVVRGVFAEGSTGEPQTIAIRQNHRSSLTVPVRRDDRFYGFIFFNSDQPDFFTYEVVERVLPHGQLLAATVVADADRIDTLVARRDRFGEGGDAHSRRNCRSGEPVDGGFEREADARRRDGDEHQREREARE